MVTSDIYEIDGKNRGVRMEKKILVIEDNPDFRQMEKKLLELAGYKVLEADNSKDGIRLAISEMPDLVIMDIRLPDKKRGIGAARLIRNNEKSRGIPILFLTGYVGGDATAEVRNIPNTRYLTKPVDMEILLKEIKDCIR